jgi:2-amino-4-hydroxy-6-hydroxymethyldihydropteridine diphosphokinase
MLNLHQVYILMGSNISPLENLRKGLDHLRSQCMILAVSNAWENAAIGSSGPNFLNLAILINTSLSASKLKANILVPLETLLGRVKSADKNSPRVIDLDIIIFDNEVQDNNLWSRLYIALPISELLPDFINPANGKTLSEIADSLHKTQWAIIQPDI